MAQLAAELFQHWRVNIDDVECNMYGTKPSLLFYKALNLEKYLNFESENKNTAIEGKKNFCLDKLPRINLRSSTCPFELKNR